MLSYFRFLNIYSKPLPIQFYSYITQITTPQSPDYEAKFFNRPPSIFVRLSKPYSQLPGFTPKFFISCMNFQYYSLILAADQGSSSSSGLAYSLVRFNSWLSNSSSALSKSKSSLYFLSIQVKYKLKSEGQNVLKLIKKDSNRLIIINCDCLQIMSEARKIRTFKDTNYFSQGTYKRQFKDYMTDIGLVNIIARTVLAPLQRWRIIKQTQTAYPFRPLVFKNAADYFSRLPKQQGLSAFWRGNLPGLWLYFTQTLIQIGLYDNLRSLQKDLTLQQQPGSFLTLLTERMFIPLISTFFTQVITFPVDTARVRITMNYAKQKSKFPFSGIRTCLKHLRNQQNFSAMYKGFLLSNAISLVNFNLYLAFVSATSSVQLGQDYKNMINGDTISAVGALLLVHPLDSLKKIIQLNNLSSPCIFKNARSAVAYIKRQSSLISLYNGLTVSVLKSFMFLPTFYLAQTAIQEGKRKIQF